MQTITKARFIAHLTKLSDPEGTVRNVEAAIADLGWHGKDVFTGAEILALATRMGELVQADLAASSDPAERAQGEAIGAYMQTMRQDVLPHLDPDR